MRAFLLIFFLFLACLVKPFPVLSQIDSTLVEVPDSVREKEHSPTKATLMSTFLPGLGQAYNKKYWKIPIIYAGLGIMGYFIYYNCDLYIDYKCAYIESSQGTMNGSYSYLVNKYSTDELLSYRENYRRNLEISIIFTVLWYGLNILDATVDAHLYTFNITDNLSMKIEPALLPSGIGYRPVGGAKICLHF
jgi:hypothetical protein